MEHFRKPSAPGCSIRPAKCLSTCGATRSIGLRKAPGRRARCRHDRRLPMRCRSLRPQSEPTASQHLPLPHVPEASGNFFSPLAGCRARISSGPGPPGIFKSSEAVERGFCPDCGTPLTFAIWRATDHPVHRQPRRARRVTPAIEYGTESSLPAFDRLHTLPGRPVGSDGDHALKRIAKFKSPAASRSRLRAGSPPTRRPCRRLSPTGHRPHRACASAPRDAVPRTRPQAAASAASMAASAASALAPSGPPACAMSRRPPPPLPPSFSAPARTRLDRVEPAGEILGHADHDPGLAVIGDADDGDDARAEALLALVGEALQVLHLDARDRAGHQLDAADVAHRIVPAPSRRRPWRACGAHRRDRARAGGGPR